MRVALADLGHNELTVSSDVYPLGVANLAVYAETELQSRERNDFQIIREPQDLKSILDNNPPDVLGVSNYAWNHELAVQFADYAKSKSPNTLILMGGPNFPLDSENQEAFLRSIPSVDVAVNGPTYEGERAFLNLLQRYIDTGRSIPDLLEESIPGNVWINRRTDEFIQGGPVARIADLDEIPSPYLAGHMDDFYATGYFPMLQIARGCPFTCAFCNSSVKFNNRIHAHSLENVQRDLLHIAQRVKPEIPLCFADDNFGMYALDEEVADYIAFLQRKFDWPQYIRTTTGKNKHERIIRVMRKTGGVMPMTSAVQSLNPEVLQNIKRSNIKLETYAEIQKELNAQGMQSYGELILCMPGETKESFLQAVEGLLDSGVKRVSAHQLMLLNGAPLNTRASREQWQFRTKFRVVARNIGNYLGEPVVETEEIVVETPTFTFDEYLECRIFHLLLTIFFYEGNYEEVFEFARQEGLKAFDLVLKMQSMLDSAPERLCALIDDFVRESCDELFDSKQECIAWSVSNYEQLIDGTIGGNLLSKYSMIGRFYLTHECLDFAEQVILAAQGDSMSDERVDMLQAVVEYLRLGLLHVPFAESVNQSPDWVTSYDVEAWRAEGYVSDLESYRLDGQRIYAMVTSAENQAKIITRVGTFGEHPAGLGKFTRTMFAHDFRRTAIPKIAVSGSTQTA